MSDAMERRRARILDQASQLLVSGDHADFSLRQLAEAAEVSVPTLYNLIGNKDTILLELTLRHLERIEGELDAIEDDDPLALAEAVVFRATAMFGEAEEMHRSGQQALEQLRRAGTHSGTFAKHDERCVQMQLRAATRAREAGLLVGRVAPRVLAQQIYRNYQLASGEWTHRVIDLERFRSRALLGVWLAWAADAVDGFREELLERVAGLPADIPHASTRSSTQPMPSFHVASSRSAGFP